MSKKGKVKLDPKIITIIAIAAVLVIVIVACVVVWLLRAESFEADTSTVFVLDKGKVVTTDIEKFDESKYSVEGLESFLNETITTYNKENGEGSVVLKEFLVEEGVATLIMEYANAGVYEDFYGIDLFTGTVSEALEAGYAFDLDFASIKDGKATQCSAKEITEQGELKVAIIKTNTRVDVKGKILYVSADNVSQVGKDWVVLKDNCNILNLPVEEVSETVESEETESSEVTEIPTEGIIEDGALVGGTTESTESTETTEDTEIIFDFGDEEVVEEEKEEIKYTEKYIYIIYK